MTKKAVCSSFAIVALSLGLTADARAQSSTFTYQGKLSDGGTPVNGTADIDFYVYDADIGGNLVAGPDSHVGVPVTDGLFTVALDFGPPSAVFDGNPRWLEIVVDATPLSPRQEVTAAPYAHFSALPWETSGADLSYTAGRVGIGSATPNHRLRVSGGPGWTSNGWIGSLELDNAAALAWRSNAGGRRFGIGQSGGGLYFFHTTSDPGTTGSPANYDMLINDSGFVGIGTNSPIARLTVETPGYGFLQTNGAVQVGSYADSAVGWYGTRSNHPLSFFTNNSLAQMTLSTAGNVGIGTSAPASKLDIVGQDGMRITGFQPFLTLRDSNGGNARGVIQSANGDLIFYTNAALATGIVPLRVQNNGVTSVRVLQVLGADLAEKFPSTDEKVEPGTVMEIDPLHAGQIRICREEYSSRVAGVVSGAGDLPAGAILGNLPGHEDAPEIALSGRVWVRCNASAAAIAPGDLLTTSATPGHAMKANDRDRSHGAILGKAMTVLNEGETGLVLVLVNLQ